MIALLRPDRFLLLAGLLCGAAFAILTPPFEVPDEPAHFARAYRVSEGWLDLDPQPGRTGALLPASVQRITNDLVAGIPFHPERKIAPAAIRAALQIPLEPARRAPFFFPSGLQYTFVPYIPQALGIAAGRLCGAPPLVLLYLARLMNLVCGVLALACAVRRLPAYQWLATLVALTPMALSLLASASADVTTLAASFTLVSTAARLAWGSGEPARRSDLALLTAAAMLLCASKPPYLPLLLLAFLIPAPRFPPGRRLRFLLLHTGLSLAMVAWSTFNARRVATFRLNAGVDAPRQIHDSLLHPWRFLKVVAVDYVVHAPRYLSELVGNLGWLDTRMPKPLVIVYLAVLLALVLLDTGSGRPAINPPLAAGGGHRRRPRHPDADQRLAVRGLDPLRRRLHRGAPGALFPPPAPRRRLGPPQPASPTMEGTPHAGGPERPPRGVQPAVVRDRGGDAGGAVLRDLRTGSLGTWTGIFLSTLLPTSELYTG